MVYDIDLPNAPVNEIHPFNVGLKRQPSSSSSVANQTSKTGSNSQLNANIPNKSNNSKRSKIQNSKSSNKRNKGGIKSEELDSIGLAESESITSQLVNSDSLSQNDLTNELSTTKKEPMDPIKNENTNMALMDPVLFTTE